MAKKKRDSSCTKLADLPGEIWLPVTMFDGRFVDCYAVSNRGRVKSLERRVKCKGNSTRVHREIILKPVTVPSGYLNVTLSKNGRLVALRINRAVCGAFHGNPKPGDEAHHIDGNRMNNHKDNLVWVSRAVHAMLDAPQKLTRQDVREIRRLRRDGYLLKEIAERFGVSPSMISAIGVGRTWKLRMINLFDRMEANHIKERALNQS